MRPCPYCDAAEARFFGVRLGATFVQCRRCRSIHMDLTLAQYERLHAEAFSDDAFIDDIVAGMQAQPDRKKWGEFRDLLPDGPVLEIGPGTGHMLAAAHEAKRTVYALESSETHREFIRRTWGIENVYASFAELPASTPPFAAVMAFNTIEHVFDLGALFSTIRERLSPNGVVLVSTCNAQCLILPIVGVYWAMFKQPDHVSIPSAQGLRALGSRLGFSTERVWTGEMPLETPIGIATAARDYLRERRQPPPSARAPARADADAEREAPPQRREPLERRLARAVTRATERVDVTRHIAARLGRAAAIRGLFRLAGAADVGSMGKG